MKKSGEANILGFPKPKKETKEDKIKKKIKRVRKKKQEKIDKILSTRKKIKPVKRKRKRKKIIKNKSWYKSHSDTLFSKLIRRRDGRCQVCGTTENLQCSHVVPRANLHLRWDDNNAKALCIKHHLYWWHRNPLEAWEWFENKFPDRTEYLRKERIKIVKLTLSDYEDLYHSLKVRMKQEK